MNGTISLNQCSRKTLGNLLQFLFSLKPPQFISTSFGFSFKKISNSYLFSLPKMTLAPVINTSLHMKTNAITSKLIWDLLGFVPLFLQPPPLSLSAQSFHSSHIHSSSVSLQCIKTVPVSGPLNSAWNPLFSRYIQKHQFLQKNFPSQSHK